jgi:mannose-6-phosphate isomerase-like protein (cupin superfamily)
MHCREVVVKHIKTAGKRGKFDPLIATRSCQAAKMTLKPGAASSPEPENEHPRCEQWLFLISGQGEAVVGKQSGRIRRVKLQPNSLLLIAEGELHQIKNTGRGPLATLNFYVPPAYRPDGTVRLRAKRPMVLARLLER